MSCADFGIHRFWKYSVFLQFLRCSFPRNNTSAKFHGYARITVSRLLPIHHHKHEYRDRMAQSFGTLEFAGESEPIFERDKNNRKVIARRSYNLYSDVQKGENVVVEIPVQAGEKHFKYEQKVKLVNPKLYGRGYAIGDVGHTDYVLVADDIVAVEEK